MFKEIVDFIRSIYNSEGLIPLHEPRFIGNEKKYLAECIDTNYVSSIGSFTTRLEDMIIRYTGSEAAVVCVNGTSALHMALLLSAVSPGDEVITQALTFVATGNSISYAGAIPVFIDVDPDTMGLSPEYLNEWLEENTYIKESVCYNKHTGRRIKACIPMHTFGHPVRIDQIIEICNRYYITVIEDAAESIGSLYRERHTGTFGSIGAISFNGNKIITTGGGGILLFKNKTQAELAKHLTTQAKIPHLWEFNHNLTGYNYRMPNINAALGCAQMEKLDEFLEDKRETASLYEDFFSRYDNVRFVKEPLLCRSNYWLNAIVFNDNKSQEDFLEYANSNGVQARPPWTLLNKLPMFMHCQTDALVNSQWLQRHLVNIPSSIRRWGKT